MTQKKPKVTPRANDRHPIDQGRTPVVGDLLILVKIVCDSIKVGLAAHSANQNQLGGPPKRVSTIRGVRAIGLADPMRARRSLGLRVPGRFKDFTRVSDLIGCIPSKRDFVTRLPTKYRAAFEELVDPFQPMHGSPIPRRLSPTSFIATHGAARRRQAT